MRPPEKHSAHLLHSLAAGITIFFLASAVSYGSDICKLVMKALAIMPDSNQLALIRDTLDYFPRNDRRSFVLDGDGNPSMNHSRTLFRTRLTYDPELNIFSVQKIVGFVDRTAEPVVSLSPHPDLLGNYTPRQGQHVYPEALEYVVLRPDGNGTFRSLEPYHPNGPTIVDLPYELTTVPHLVVDGQIHLNVRRLEYQERIRSTSMTSLMVHYFARDKGEILTERTINIKTVEGNLLPPHIRISRTIYRDVLPETSASNDLNAMVAIIDSHRNFNGFLERLQSQMLFIDLNATQVQSITLAYNVFRTTATESVPLAFNIIVPLLKGLSRRQISNLYSELGFFFLSPS